MKSKMKNNVKNTMKCNIYQFLFERFPVKRLQTYVMDNHFSACPRCQELSTLDNTMETGVITPDHTAPMDSMWPGIRQAIHTEAGDNTITLPRRRTPGSTHRTLKWALTAATLLVAVIFSPSVLPTRCGEPPVSPDAGGEQIIALNAATLDGQPAQTHTFNSTDAQMTMIWVEKTN